MINGFLRIAAAAPAVSVADVDFNVDRIIEMTRLLASKGVETAVFPELCITGYTCGDLFHSTTLLDAAMKGLDKIKEHSENWDIDIIVGLPVRMDGAVYNCAAFVSAGRARIVRKTYIPNYNEFYERRWFAPAPETLNVDEAPIISHGVQIGIEICEDLWVTIPPSCRLSLEGAKVIFNLSASDDLIGKYAYTIDLIRQQSGRCLCAYAYAGAGYGESSTDLVFAGKAVIAENGSILHANDRWDPADNYSIADIDIEGIERNRLHTTTFADCQRRETHDISEVPHTDSSPWDWNHTLDYRTVSRRPFVPPTDELLDARCTEIVNIQCAGLAKRLEAIHCSQLVVGISGGLDSTLALLVAVRTFDRLHLDRKGIIAVTMPGFGTTDRTYTNALNLMQELQVTIREIPIADAVMQHFRDIGHDASVHDVTYENSQARERTQILMDVANQVNGIVLGTGDLSELALGWATYNGDHMSMYGVNGGIPKTLVRYLVDWFATRAGTEAERITLLDIIDTPISPELTPADSEGNIKQKTEDLVGPYELHDFFLYYTLRYGYSPRRILYLALKAFGEAYPLPVILSWLGTFFRRFFAQQFKRSCLPDGPKVGSVCLSPRGDWRMPSDASSRLWMAEIETIRKELLG